MTALSATKISPGIAYLMTFLGVMGHASSEFFAILSGISGPEVSVWRFIIGALGLLAMCLVWPPYRDLWTPLRRHWRELVPLSMFRDRLALCETRAAQQPETQWEGEAVLAWLGQDSGAQGLLPWVCGLGLLAAVNIGLYATAEAGWTPRLWPYT